MLTVAIALVAEIEFDFDSAFKLANIVKYRDIDATVSTVAMQGGVQVGQFSEG